MHTLIDALSAGNGYSYAEGGDEVIVLLANSTEAMGQAFAAAALDRIRQKVFRIGDEEVRVTASAGLASSERFPLDELADAANRAKTEAKTAGRDRFIVARAADFRA
jgi:GGDEF domain-containing protein